jgi:carboxymethylenebutenolidase
MGNQVDWNVGGRVGSGYLAVPAGGSGPGVIVIQEWWGLVPHIAEVCDRYAAEGFVALAPDLYGGRTTTEPDEAGKLMMTMNLPAAVEILSDAIDYLRSLDEVTSDGVGVTGFCMGGGLAMLAACHRPDAVAACVSYYGVIPWPDAEPDWSALAAPMLGHFAQHDAMFGPDKVEGLRQRLADAGKDVTFIVHPDTDHAFFNDHRPEVFSAEAAESSWAQTIGFLTREVR